MRFVLFLLAEFEHPIHRFGGSTVPKEYDIEELTDDHGEGGSARIRRSHSDRQRKKTVKHREREVRDRIGEITNTIEGRITSTEGASFVVHAADGIDYKARTVKSTVSGNPMSTLAAVGDRVSIELGEDEFAVIREVHPRKTKLSRKSHKRKAEFEQVIAANVDRLLITASVGEPPFYSHIVDRYMVAGLDGQLDVAIIVNKIDLLPGDKRADEIEEKLAYYESLGYKVFRTSTEAGIGLEELRTSLEGVTAVLAGRSGVGKSSLINALAGNNMLRTSDLTKKERRGKHTTTGGILLPLEGVENAFLVDTPGVREFFNYDLDPENLKFRYIEFLRYQEHCKLTNCMHIHEPECAVAEAVDEGLIPEWRYTSYNVLYAEATPRL